jgi:fructose-1,6-bisphosphatase
MMRERETTVSEWIVEEQRRSPGATGMFSSLLIGLRIACKRIAWLIGEGRTGAVPEVSLEVAANDIFMRTIDRGGSLAGIASRDGASPITLSTAQPIGRYLVVCTPIDGAPNVDVNVSAGSIFSVLRAPDHVVAPTATDFLQPGTQQVAAGYAIYGPTTMLVLTVGRGVCGFTLNRGFGEFILTHPDLTIPETTREFAVNTSNARFWESPVQRYVEECVKGKDGPRGEDFNMRWIASFVAEVHRILVRGGLFMYPADTREGSGDGRNLLLFEANPLAMLVEQAGGAASTGRGRILEVVPNDLRQRVPVVLGSREEVERVERYHHDADHGVDREFTSPLFNQRSLFPIR